ncbi:Mediator of RNA polymerase II transcription subunit 8 AltName: Full=Mediator complex subunit 8 [Cyberlindnera jadinii]|uniref:Mediator of RNA polymerase II transcription subunit 8 n=1 Tax=Cyberlindnera jadinii (strain ATCC 18201 / CBS 1600 / BCRC 20928 / JCM 3617 / NBRC 0987 / NRRL Y-1542) TaxID=983966 RepID=A0A0H5C1F4_CYBJN|nr:mediator of RNA polymerase II transcription subunit 8 [Cyberlindnera jadinii NRRL Y-1542]ODV74827.1 mediator of RNA polymerase II transcription subunit 8 [Cyberlindnera jadinii NRRL Y-1542]CEP21506.1 Mediator of RNA polymerase II transcription subunit 8 AltName: Full=Mediator complex subunit 8 [Cyberlindnera jadinii]
MQAEQKQPVDHSGVPVEALEALRLRLTQLTHSLNKLQAEFKNPQLTHYVSLQAQLSIILTQLGSLSSTLSSYSDVLERTVAYPLPTFPTTEQEGLLTTLLRKKATPEVVEWIEESKSKNTDFLLKDDEDITKWAARCTVDTKEKYNFVGFKTKQEEREANGDDEKDVDIADEPAASSKYSVDQILKFMYQGDITK